MIHILHLIVVSTSNLIHLLLGSALSPIIANIFLNSFETKYLSECPPEYQLFYYRRYLDDTFILFNRFNQATNFYNYSNSRRTEINFKFEGESKNKLSFLDLTVEKAYNEFSTSIFRKKKLSQVLVSNISVIYYRVCQVYGNAHFYLVLQ